MAGDLWWQDDRQPRPRRHACGRDAQRGAATRVPGTVAQLHVHDCEGPATVGADNLAFEGARKIAKVTGPARRDSIKDMPSKPTVRLMSGPPDRPSSSGPLRILRSALQIPCRPSVSMLFVPLITAVRCTEASLRLATSRCWWVCHRWTTSTVAAATSAMTPRLR